MDSPIITSNEVQQRHLKHSDIMWHHVTSCDIMWHYVTHYISDIMWHHVTLCDIMWHSEVFRCIQSYSTCCTSQKDLHSPTCFRTSWLLQELVSKKPWKGEQCGNHGWRCWWIEYKPWCWANLVGLVGGWWNIGPSGFNVAWMLQEAVFFMVLQFYMFLQYRPTPSLYTFRTLHNGFLGMTLGWYRSNME